MAGWSDAQIAFVVERYFSNNYSLTAAQRAFRQHYRTREAPSREVVNRAVRNFRQDGSAKKRKSPGRPRSARTPANIAIVRNAIANSPHKSTRKLTQQVNMRRTTVRRILRRDLRLYPYKTQVVQELKPPDRQSRVRFAHWFLAQCPTDNDPFLNNLLTSDEAHFQLNGFVNKQNCRFWGATNPHLIHEVPLHSQRVTVWCGIMSSCVIGPYFFQDVNGNAVTVTSQRYVDMLRTFLVPELRRRGLMLPDIWFQQDGATSHTAAISMAELRRHFRPDHIVSRFGAVNWPSRSPDLTPPDFFLWGFLKSTVYASRPRTLQELKTNVTTAVSAIQPEILRKVLVNMRDRALECVARRGEHLQDVIFKK